VRAALFFGEQKSRALRGYHLTSFFYWATSSPPAPAPEAHDVLAFSRGLLRPNTPPAGQARPRQT